MLPYVEGNVGKVGNLETSEASETSELLETSETVVHHNLDYSFSQLVALEGVIYDMPLTCY